MAVRAMDGGVEASPTCKRRGIGLVRGLVGVLPRYRPLMLEEPHGGPASKDELGKPAQEDEKSASHGYRCIFYIEKPKETWSKLAAHVPTCQQDDACIQSFAIFKADIPPSFQDPEDLAVIPEQ